MKRVTPAVTASASRLRAFAVLFEIIAERVGDGFRNDDLGGEMDDRIDLVLGEQSRAPESASPKSPTISGTPGGTAERKPVERSSSTTTLSPASRSSSVIWLPI